MLLTVNLAFGITAVVLMSLVLRGELAHTLPRDSDGKFKGRHELTPGDFMRLGIVLYHFKGLIRIGLWDIVFLVLRWDRVWWGSALNILFCGLAILGSLAVLKALHLSIPEKDREGYSIFTAPWYPDLPPLKMRWFI